MAPHSHLTDFVREFEGLYSAASPETFWACELLIQQLLKEGIVQDWFSDQLRKLCNEPQHLGDWLTSEVVLHHGKGWTASVVLLEGPHRYVHVLPFLGYYAPIGIAGFAVDRYRLPPGYRNEVFDPTISLEHAGREQINPGSFLRVEADTCAYDFQLPVPVPVLRIATAPIRPLEWLFSKNTLQAWQANDADLGYTQLRVAAYVLGRIAHQSSLAPLKTLSSHPHHSVRWAAIQNLGRLNRSEALLKIREAVNDPHPHVRRAAQKTLDQLNRRTP